MVVSSTACEADDEKRLSLRLVHHPENRPARHDRKQLSCDCL